MKKILFIFGLMVSMMACTNGNVANTTESADSTLTDSAAVVDLVITDSVVVDSIAD